MLNDPIADMLTRIRNAVQQKHRYVDIGLSKMNVSILSVLKEEGFLNNFMSNEKVKKIRVFLRYAVEQEALIKGLKRISKPGRRIYSKSLNLPFVKNGLGISIVSTPQGVMCGYKAREQKLGGEVICFVWSSIKNRRIF